MLRPLIAATAVVALLAGCSGGDDTKSDSSTGDGGGESASTPNAPNVPSFDPPKGFVAAAAIGEPDIPKLVESKIKAGMIGRIALYATQAGISGADAAGQSSSWNVPASDVSTTTTSDVTKPVAVQLNGKEAVAVAFVQRAQGTGTQKARGQINFLWLDPADGKKLAQVILDLTAAVGPDEGGDDVLSQAADPATGQLAMGLSPDSETAAKKVGQFTVYADPATQKGSVIPNLRVAGLLNGVVAGARGDGHEGSTELSAALVDATTGAVKKNTPIAMNYLNPVAAAPKHGYLTGQKYVSPPAGKYEGHYVSSIYSIDLTTGAVVESKFANTTDDPPGRNCWSDEQTAVVCNSGEYLKPSTEIFGIDDTTGKKVWGYTSTSGSRVVPEITAAYHGVVYTQAEALPVLMDAKTGQDIPTPTPTPADGSTPSTPTDTSSPTSETTPTDGSSPSLGGDSDLSLLRDKVKSPTAVSPYGGTYLQDPLGDDLEHVKILIVLKATA
ncbi:MAG TPA: hypothetical protein VFG33_00210 [Kribbella sp.]|uniref:hypothetical protein n=1 Tax=Kribbella sp. TaxID=1871183 RepID=UPI002D798C8D|nr:hypothetical protein [Kribbella sp.]HET6291753.1 hypothetical protein [Kribbella sp.]